MTITAPDKELAGRAHLLYKELTSRLEDQLKGKIGVAVGDDGERHTVFYLPCQNRDYVVTLDEDARAPSITVFTAIMFVALTKPLGFHPNGLEAAIKAIHASEDQQ